MKIKPISDNWIKAIKETKIPHEEHCPTSPCNCERGMEFKILLCAIARIEELKRLMRHDAKATQELIEGAVVAERARCVGVAKRFDKGPDEQVRIVGMIVEGIESGRTYNGT